VFSALSLFSGPQAEMEFRATSLDPDTGYSFAAWAKDPETDEEQLTTGSFSTLRRTLHWTIDRIKVTDDSDDLSAGDLYFQYRMGGVSSGVAYYEIDTDDSVYPNALVAINDYSSASVNLAVLGIDEDNFDDDPSPGMIGGLFWVGCSSSSNPWDIACGSNSVNVARDGTDEEFTTGVTLHASGHSLAFRIETTLRVFYEP
jgi:hypothetical protein